MQNDFFCPAVDAISPAHPLHLIGGFQCLGHAFPAHQGTPDETNSFPNIVVQHSDSDEQDTEATTGLYFQDSVMNNYLREWLLHQQELRRGEITRDQYFEWKLNWPYT